MWQNHELPRVDNPLYKRNVLIGWSAAIRHVDVGLKNKDNTCFVNATMQALFHIPAFLHFIIDEEHRRTCFSLLDCSQCAIYRSWLGISLNTNTYPQDILQLLPKLMSGHKQGEQEDAHEFLQFLLDNLAAQFLRKHPTKDFCLQQTTGPGLIFTGWIKSSVRCTSCNVKSVTYAPRAEVIVECDTRSLQESISEQLKSDILDIKCKCGMPMKKKESYFIYPNVVKLMLKRFDPDTNLKNTTRVEIPLNMMLGEQKYKFLSGIIHVGPIRDKGHYKCVAACPDWSMTLFDDLEVSKVDYDVLKDDAITTGMYVVFYEREKSQPNASVKRPFEKTSIPNGRFKISPAKSYKSIKNRKGISILKPREDPLKVLLKASVPAKSMVSCLMITQEDRFNLPLDAANRSLSTNQRSPFEKKLVPKGKLSDIGLAKSKKSTGKVSLIPCPPKPTKTEDNLALVKTNDNIENEKTHVGGQPVQDSVDNSHHEHQTRHTRKQAHWDAALMNIGRKSSHVNAALQALLHIPEFVKVLEEDSEHRSVCRSLLCMFCAFWRLISSMKSVGMGDPCSFVLLWNGLSLSLETHQCKNDPFHVFDLFVSRLILDVLERNSEYSANDYLQSPVRKCLIGAKYTTAQCKLCGNKFSPETIRPLIIEEELSLKVLNEYFMRKTERQCEFCGKFQTTTTDSLSLPPYFVVKSKVACSPTFRLPMSLNIFSESSKLHSCMVQSEESAFFISLCEDGSVRFFQDEKITKLSLGRLATSDIFKNCKLSVIYKKEETLIRNARNTFTKDPVTSLSINQQLVKEETPMLKSGQIPKDASILKPITKQKYKIIGMPELQCDLYSDLPESPKARTIGTQTEPARTVDCCTQTERSTFKQKPMVYYEKCKHHNKFEFFTGLNVLDFEAFHEFIGGEEVINRLKMNYNLKTPEKPIKSALSSRDKLFMFLLRLRRGLPLEEMGFIFDYSVPHVSELCYIMTRLIYETFKGLEDKVFISAAEQARNKPRVMKIFKNLRVILDGASFFIEAPSNFQMQGNTHSVYKSHNVILFVIGVSCHGSSIFCSKGFEGSISDKGATLKSPEFLDKLAPGDAVMVDRGFDITAELLLRGVRVIRPPNKNDDEDLNASEELFTKAVASARIYVEHAIADIKDNRLLQGVIPLTMLPVLPQLVYIATFLRNFSTKKIRNTQVNVVV